MIDSINCVLFYSYHTFVRWIFQLCPGGGGGGGGGGIPGPPPFPISFPYESHYLQIMKLLNSEACECMEQY